MPIRQAVSGDAPGIAKVHVDSWRTTYKGIIPDRFLLNLSYEQRTELWDRNIAAADNFVVVAENEEGEIVGFADGSKKATNSVPNSGDLTSIYMLEAYQGKGLGKKLLEPLFEHFRRQGYRKVFVEVLEANKTRYFYEYYGARLIQTVPIVIGGTTLGESIYEWADVDDFLKRLRA